MELKEFVKTALIELADGIKEANLGLDRKGAEGKPLYVFQIPNRIFAPEKSGPSFIEFDVAVAASEEREGVAKGGLKVLSIGVSGEKGIRSASDVTSRVKFRVLVEHTIF